MIRWSGIAEEVTFEQKPKGSKETDCINNFKKDSIPRRRKTKGKDPDTKVCMTRSRKAKGRCGWKAVMKVRMIGNEEGDAAQVQSHKILYIIARDPDFILELGCFECYGKPWMIETHHLETRIHVGEGTGSMPETSLEIL